MATTVEDVLKVINSYYSDTSRSAEETLIGLEEIEEDVNMKISALNDD
jgi:hypothetical protein